MFLCPSISCRPDKAILMDNYPMGSKPRKLVTRDDGDDEDDDDQCPSCDGQYPMLLESLRPECFRANNTNKVAKKKKTLLHQLEHEDVKISIFNPITLGDWLLSIPGSKLYSFREGELCVLKNIRPRGPTSSPSRASSSSAKAGDDHDQGFSLERLVMLDRARDLEEEHSYSCGASSSFSVSSSMKRGRSGNKEIIKTVRFRSPEGLAHVFLFSSPPPAEE